MRTRTRALLAAAACLTTLAATACSSDAPRTTQATTVTATVTASSEPAAEAAGGETAAADDTGSAQSTPQEPTGAPDGSCGPGRIDSGRVTAAIAKVPTDLPNYQWVARGSNFSTCNDISYVALDTVGATAGSPQQLLIFDRAQRFLGTGIKCNAGYQTVIGSSADAITVRYRYLQGRDISAAPSGSATVTFRWNGTRVVMDGTLPYGVTQGRC
ncbi:MAG: LppP/LprE family lipoprotein [Corynebacteriales bacterium]|uniref:LppP/LprE family lipoprotein n=1 Tax=Williamsia herbipolensis TaxID=1603258 RepID=A0AAU4K1Y0_9NOCA|nr:LppP/LprE family lipoprotein [Williamsia herbipolensis]MCX6470508.1 LppP/LprE family lipoprotein [Mycobacteriales bacterium]